MEENRWPIPLLATDAATEFSKYSVVTSIMFIGSTKKNSCHQHSCASGPRCGPDSRQVCLHLSLQNATRSMQRLHKEETRGDR